MEALGLRGRAAHPLGSEVYFKTLERRLGRPGAKPQPLITIYRPGFPCPGFTYADSPGQWQARHATGGVETATTAV